MLELWNCLSYRGLSYFFEVRSQTFRSNCKILRLQPQNSTSIVIRPQRKNVQSKDYSTLHNSQRRKELQFSQTQLSGRSWRNTRYYIFWTSRTFVKSLRTHLPSIFSLKFCHQGALIIVSLLEKSINVESVENCDHRCYSYLKNKVKLFS